MKVPILLMTSVMMSLSLMHCSSPETSPPARITIAGSVSPPNSGLALQDDRIPSQPLVATEKLQVANLTVEEVFIDRLRILRLSHRFNDKAEYSLYEVCGESGACVKGAMRRFVKNLYEYPRGRLRVSLKHCVRPGRSASAELCGEAAPARFLAAERADDEATAKLRRLYVEYDGINESLSKKADALASAVKAFVASPAFGTLNPQWQVKLHNVLTLGPDFYSQLFTSPTFDNFLTLMDAKASEGKEEEAKLGLTADASTIASQGLTYGGVAIAMLGSPLLVNGLFLRSKMPSMDSLLAQHFSTAAARLRTEASVYSEQINGYVHEWAASYRHSVDYRAPINSAVQAIDAVTPARVENPNGFIQWAMAPMRNLYTGSMESVRSGLAAVADINAAHLENVAQFEMRTTQFVDGHHARMSAMTADLEVQARQAGRQFDAEVSSGSRKLIMAGGLMMLIGGVIAAAGGIWGDLGLAANPDQGLPALNRFMAPYWQELLQVKALQREKELELGAAVAAENR